MKPSRAYGADDHRREKPRLLICREGILDSIVPFSFSVYQLLILIGHVCHGVLLLICGRFSCVAMFCTC